MRPPFQGRCFVQIALTGYTAPPVEISEIVILYNLQLAIVDSKRGA